MKIAGDGLMRRQPFEPGVVIGVESPFVVVDKDGRGDVHGVDERQTLPNAALLQGRLDLSRDVQIRATAGRLELQLLAIRLHGRLSVTRSPSQNWATLHFTK